MAAASATLIAVSRLRDRLTAAEHALRRCSEDAGFLDALADVDRALTSFATTIGLERRAAVLCRRRALPSTES